MQLEPSHAGVNTMMVLLVVSLDTGPVSVCSRNIIMMSQLRLFPTCIHGCDLQSITCVDWSGSASGFSNKNRTGVPIPCMLDSWLNISSCNFWQLKATCQSVTAGVYNLIAIKSFMQMATPSGRLTYVWCIQANAGHTWPSVHRARGHAWVITPRFLKIWILPDLASWWVVNTHTCLHGCIQYST